MKLFEELRARGLIAQMTDEENIEKILNDEKVTFYIGFDPTADSLHIGHFLQMVVMKHMQRAGHRPIALFGGGTGMVGDPTGKTDMRKMMTTEMIDHNIECFKKQMSRFIEFGDDKAIIANNANWLRSLNYIEFLRDIGVHFSVNKMLTAKCFKTRLERGLSFLEFNYMLMQSYDFLYLNNEYNCVLELGGDDQWSNILGGVDLIRSKNQKQAYGMTFTLLTTSDGRKMGKTESGAVWLDPEKTSPYDFYQYWRNIDDKDVIRCMKLLTFIPLEKIEEYEKCEGSEINKIKEILAHEITAMVHGTEEADKALTAAKNVFGAGTVDENMPSTELGGDDITDGKIGLLDVLAKTGLCPSKSEARRVVSGGGISIDGEKISDAGFYVDVNNIKDGFFVIKKGKKTFHKVIVSEK